MNKLHIFVSSSTGVKVETISNDNENCSATDQIATSKGKRNCAISPTYEYLNESETEEIEEDYGDITDSSLYEPDTNEPESSSDDEFDFKLNKHENFGGFNEDIPKEPRKLKRCQTSVLNPIKMNCQLLPLVKNGHISTMTTFTSTKTKKKIVTVNTCAFDAYFQFFACCYVDLPTFQREVTFGSIEVGDPLANLISDFFTTKLKDFYNQRNDVLFNYYTPDIVTKKLLHVDCATTPSFVFERMCEENRLLCSYKIEYKCESCDLCAQTQFSNYVIVDTANFDIRNVQRHIKQPTIEKKGIVPCELCENQPVGNIITNDVIIIEAYRLIKDSRKTEHSSASIVDTSQEIEFQNITFELCGVICYRNVGIGHFYLYAKRPNSTWQIYDDLAKKPKLAGSNDLRATLEIVVLFYKRKISDASSHAPTDLSVLNNSCNVENESAAELTSDSNGKSFELL